MYTTIFNLFKPLSCADDVFNGDGQCDDDLNLEECGFDGGDCFGSDGNKLYCEVCECLQPVKR